MRVYKPASEEETHSAANKPDGLVVESEARADKLCLDTNKHRQIDDKENGADSGV